MDVVIPQSTLSDITNLLEWRPAYVVHGDDWKKGVQDKTREEVVETLAGWGGTLIEPSYTEDMSTTKIINIYSQIDLSPTTKQMVSNETTVDENELVYCTEVSSGNHTKKIRAMASLSSLGVAEITDEGMLRVSQRLTSIWIDQ